MERKNKDCTSENPQGIKLAMSKVYKIDKVACLKHIAAQHKTSLSYHSRTEEAEEQLLLKNKNRDTRTYLLISLQTLVLQIDPQTLAVVKPLH